MRWEEEVNKQEDWKKTQEGEDIGVSVRGEEVRRN
jgi:hypothetical protein